jgi:hypothetical protein
LFEVASEYMSPVARVDLRIQESQRECNDLSWFGPIDALRPAADDPYTQEHLKSGGYNKVLQEKVRDLVGDSSVLILRLLRRWWSLPLVGEEEDNGSGGGALDAPLWIALLSVPSRSESVRNGMICLGSSSPISGFRPILYIPR